MKPVFNYPARTVTVKGITMPLGEESMGSDIVSERRNPKSHRVGGN